MNDLISRKEVKAIANKFTFTDKTQERQYKDFLKHCLDHVSTVEPVRVVWKQINGFEGLYEISSLGEVRNREGVIKKQGIKKGRGTCYKTVKLWKDGKYHTKYIHRMIAEAFIPNPENLPFVNHKDEDGTNNLIKNLEWCTREYNANYGTAKERRRKKLINVPLTEERKQNISKELKKFYSEKGADMRGEKNE